ncbi:MAG: 4Fe-4S binding protein [Tannerellaceae bacterium]|jgi:polyferredoxin|nr:4Fe-4S binding protein [Tannerellaceae bacterium]
MRREKTTVMSALIAAALPVSAQNRFPKPDFESGYRYPDLHYEVPNEALWSAVDIILLAGMMLVVAWATLKRRRRAPVLIVSVVSALYFGFFRSGCVCSIGSVQNLVLAMVDSSYVMPLAVFLFFILPIVFTFLFGRVFCSGVCPLGALQEIVNIRNYRLSKAVSAVLGIIPWVYLAFALLYAATRSSFIICRFDPFIGIFRMGGDVGMIVFGGLLLLAAVFTGRPFCRFLCPYGALLSLFSRVSLRNMSITKECINCDLCLNACPVDAIRPPFENRVKESRMDGVRRLLAYFVMLPVAVAAGAFGMKALSPSLAGANKDVRLYEQVMRNEAHPQNIQPVDVEVFFAQGGTIEELSERRAEVGRQFDAYSAIAGGAIGLVVGLTLIGLSVKRTRKTYEIDGAACINCGRCFAYCPQNKLNTTT